MKRFIYIVTIIFSLILLVGSYYIYKSIAIGAPLNKPKVTIVLNGKIISTSFGEHNWINSDGGNSFLAGSSYDIGQSIEANSAEAESVVEVKISSKPKGMKVLQWKDDNSFSTIVDTSNSRKKYEFTLPKEKGIYIYEVSGYWNDKHNTSDIFKVKVE